jgi:hypothetical protein
MPRVAPTTNRSLTGGLRVRMPIGKADRWHSQTASFLEIRPMGPLPQPLCLGK